MFPFHKSTRKIFDKFSHPRRRQTKDLTRPKNISSNPKNQKPLKSLKESFKTGTMEKNRESGSILSEVDLKAKEVPLERPAKANIYSNNEIGLTHTSNADQLKLQTISGSLTKEKNVKRMSGGGNKRAHSKSVFEILQDSEPPGRK